MTYPNTTQRAPRDHDAYSKQQPQYLGAARTASGAQHKADEHTYEVLKRGHLDTSGDLESLYNGVPAPCTSIDAPLLQQAAALFFKHKEAQDDERNFVPYVDRALDALRSQLWEVYADGTLHITGEEGTHRVDDEQCFVIDTKQVCPSQLFHGRLHGGECKHVVARELIRLAQGIFTRSTVTVHINSTFLMNALAILSGAPDEPLLIKIAQDRITFTVGYPAQFGITCRVAQRGQPIKVEIPAINWINIHQAVQGLTGQLALSITPSSIVLYDHLGHSTLTLTNHTII